MACALGAYSQPLFFTDLLPLLCLAPRDPTNTPPPLLITLILSLAPPGSLLLLCLEPSNLGMLFSKLSYMDRSRGQERQENGAGRSGTGAGSRSRKWEHDTGAGQEHHARMSVPWACPGLFAPLKARVWAGRG